ncbi:N-acetylglucosamine-6-phosphate deacetylase [Glaciecola sp. 2405UD65-10]|uniref:N-acetylglucosamine-6-phosphate deacetylase n=1 Tax=Glaciecola sp. 2405UD65-10 TaxID=3397244 RepID=UPI003B5933ED
MIKTVINGNIFDGEALLDGYALIIDDDTITDLIPQASLPKDLPIGLDLKGQTLAPGFIDLQVNGGGGVMFNSAPSVESLKIIADAHRQYGSTGIYPTLITDSFDAMRKAIAAVTQAIDEGVDGILGIHLEGPFLNPERKGAHAQEKFCIIDDEGFDIVTSLSKGKTLITIAPELTSPSMISKIVEAGVVVSAGHSSANFDECELALNAGLSGFTHLYNAMTPLQSRAPGMVGAALANENSWFGIIADGFHMHPAAFKVAVSAKQKGGAILVTDAMSTVGSKSKSFVLDGQTIHAINGRCTNSEGSLAGSDLNMNAAVKNAIKFAHLDWTEAVRMASVYPAIAMGIDNEMGYLKAGYKANAVLLDQHLNVAGTIVNGKFT